MSILMPVQSALGEIDLLATAFTDMFSVKFIRKNFYLFTAIGAFTGKRLKVFELLKPGAVLGCSHGGLLLFKFLIFYHLKIRLSNNVAVPESGNTLVYEQKQNKQAGVAFEIIFI